MGSYPVLERLDYNGKVYLPGQKPVTIDDVDLVAELQGLKVIGDKVVSAAKVEDTSPASTVEELTKLGKTKLAALAKVEDLALPAEAKDAPAMAQAIFAARAAKVTQAGQS